MLSAWHLCGKYEPSNWLSRPEITELLSICLDHGRVFIFGKRTLLSFYGLLYYLDILLMFLIYFVVFLPPHFPTPFFFFFFFSFYFSIQIIGRIQLDIYYIESIGINGVGNMEDHARAIWINQTETKSTMNGRWRTSQWQLMEWRMWRGNKETRENWSVALQILKKKYWMVLKSTPLNQLKYRKLVLQRAQQPQRAGDIWSIETSETIRTRWWWCLMLAWDRHVSSSILRCHWFCISV